MFNLGYYEILPHKKSAQVEKSQSPETTSLQPRIRTTDELGFLILVMTEALRDQVYVTEVF